MDHLEAMMFAGFCHLLGDENVVTYPFKKSYYGMADDTYILDGGKTGYTSPYEALVPRKGEPLDITGIKEIWDEFLLIVMGTVRTYGIRALRELKRELGNRWSQPLVFVEGEDSSTVRWDLVNEFNPLVYFKREYARHTTLKAPPGIKCSPPVIPCPFSAMDEKLPPVADRTINLFSVFGDTHPFRKTVFKELLNLKIPNSCIWLDNFLTDPNHGHRGNLYNYLADIGRSRIGLSIRGHGMDTLRYLEIPMMGTLLFTHDTGQIYPNPFEDGKNCVMFKNDLSDFKYKLEYYLEDENECRRIANSGREHLYRYHTCKKRAEYIVKTTEDIS